MIEEKNEKDSNFVS